MNPVLPVLWLMCGGAVVVSAIRSRRHAGAVRQGRFAVAGLFIAAGAAVNAFLLAFDSAGYTEFADGSYSAFVRDTWHSLVVPNITGWIMLLIVFELGVGMLALRGGAATQLAYAAAIAFHVALMSFGVGFFFWSLPMIAALSALLVAERKDSNEQALHRPAGHRAGAVGVRI